MKRITPAILSAVSIFALSFSVSSYADNTDSDGFIIFGAPTELPQTASTNVTAQAATSAKIVELAPTEKAQVAAVQEKAKKKVVTKAKKKTPQTTKTRRSKNLRKVSSYRVRSGDTLYRISVKTGVKMNRLVRLNKLYGSKKHKLKAGQKLRLR